MEPPFTSATNRRLAIYQSYREIGRALNDKIIQEAGQSAMKNSARLLGILRNDKLVFDSEAEMDWLGDFMLNEYRNKDGKNILQLYLAKHHAALRAEEREILTVGINAETSLFKIKAVDKDNSTLLLADVFNEGNEAEIVDRGLSSSLQSGSALLFCRILRFADFNSTSGVAAVFDKDIEALLKEKYPKLLKSIPVKDEQAAKFIAFFKLNRKYGRPILLL